MNTETNPLQKFYRNVTTYIKLPSRGKFYKDGIVELNDEGEIGIMPMTAQDEIVLKNPDSLLNGKAIVDVLKSCVPGVKQPNKLLACDIDAILIGVRAASYGDDATLAIKCPNCGADNTFSLNLDMLLNASETLDDVYDVVLDNGVTVFLAPGKYESMVKSQQTMFENSKIQRALANPELTDEQRMKLIAVAFEKISKFNFDLIADCIMKIIFTDDDGEKTITKKEWITDFIKNIKSNQVERVSDKLAEINKIGIQRTLDAVCTSCSHTWEAPIEFNPVNFS